MVQFSQLLIGSFYAALVAFASWLIGLLMGVGLAKIIAMPAGKHADVEQLLARQRAAAGKGAGSQAAAAPGASTAANAG